MQETRQEYIERMARIAIKRSWTKDELEWLDKHWGVGNDIVAEIEEIVRKHCPKSTDGNHHFEPGESSIICYYCGATR